ncbi:MAG: selenocysteine-specific translation elongation factor [Acidobacteriota bacterium]
MSTPRSVVIGTAGHIDHGKSSLVRALTGTDPDRLPEEQRRGITIDLGFAHYEYESTTVWFVDVPGHERFVHNMLAGATGIDAVMLVVAADEGVMPQTREHLAITQLLRVPLGVVALTRTDLVDSAMVELAAEDVRSLLAEWGCSAVPILPVSAVTGEGLMPLRSALAAQSLTNAAEQPGPWPRLPIDRVFSVKGFGTVATGTLQGGALRVGMMLRAVPNGPVARIRGLQVHGDAVEETFTHARVAVNLQGVEREQLVRGMVLVPPDHDVVLTSFEAVLEVWKESSIALEDATRVRVHHGTAEVMGRLWVGRQPLAPGQKRGVQIRLESPLAALPGDRFVLRRYSPVETLAGGEIVRLDPPRWKRTDQEAPHRTMALAGATREQRLAAAMSAAGARGVRLSDAASTLAMTLDQARAASVQVPKSSLLGGELLISREARLQLEEKLEQFLKRFHRDRPLDDGCAPDLLRQSLVPHWPAESFRDWLDQLQQSEQVKASREAVRLPRHQPLTGDAAAAVDRIAAVLAAAGLDAPTEEELGVRAELGPRASEIIGFAVRKGVAVRLPQRLVIGSSDWRHVVSRLREEAAAGRVTLDVSAFKEIFGLTRRVAIPLLERLDDQGITQRVGNQRRIRLAPIEMDGGPDR